LTKKIHILYRDDSFDFLEGVTNFSRHFSRLGTYSPSIHIGLPLFLYKNRIDVFHSTYFVKPIWMPCKSLVTIYDLIYSRYPEYISKGGFTKGALLYHNIMTSIAVKQSSKIITISKSAKDDIMHFFKCHEDKIEVIMPAFDKENFKVISNRDLVKKTVFEYNLPDKYIFYVGAHKPHKNLERLIRAFYLIADEIEHNLVIGGKKDLRYARNYELVKSLNLERRIIFTGEIKEIDLPLLYNGADLFVFPSLYEGFGLPPLEAMACGIPVLVSNAASLPEVVGDAAIMVNPYNVEEIAQEMKRILTNKNLQAEMQIKGLERCQNFSWRKAAERTLELYKTLFHNVE
jgi:glycosyltransferase involved in cell wall biosynthesis